MTAANILFFVSSTITADTNPRLHPLIFLFTWTKPFKMGLMDSHQLDSFAKNINRVRNSDYATLNGMSYKRITR